MEEKLLFNSLLRLAKDELGLSRVSQELGIDMPTLSKYSTGKLHPSIKRIRELLPRLTKMIDPRASLERSLREGIMEGPELNNVLSTRPYLAVWAAIELKRGLDPKKYSKILTVEGGGISISTIISMLEGKRIVYALRNTFVPRGLTEPCTPLHSYSGEPKSRAYITLPPKAVSRDDRVLVVDDVSWTGCTLTSLQRLAHVQGGEVTAVSVVALSRDILEKAREVFPQLRYLLVI